MLIFVAVVGSLGLTVGGAFAVARAAEVHFFSYCSAASHAVNTSRLASYDGHLCGACMSIVHP